MKNLIERLLQGDRRALARLLTYIENDQSSAQTYLTDLHRYTGRATIIGITGSPGAGKSTLVTQLIRAYRAQERKVGVIAIDPSSPFSGGAILGDRIRMMELAGDPSIFIRSMASRGNLGGLTNSTRDAIRAMDAAGYDPIIIETVGTGQAEVEIMSAAQTVLVVIAPGMGDDIQAIKAGILEIADIFVVSKADKPGADQTVAELAMLLSLKPQHKHASWQIPIVKTSSFKALGIVDLVTAIHNHQLYLQESGEITQRTQRQIQSELHHLILQALTQTLYAQVDPQEWLGLIEAVRNHERTPYEIASEIHTRLISLHLNPDE